MPPPWVQVRAGGPVAGTFCGSGSKSSGVARRHVLRCQRCLRRRENADFFLPGHTPAATANGTAEVDVNGVALNFFATMEIPLAFGRNFDAHDIVLALKWRSSTRRYRANFSATKIPSATAWAAAPPRPRISRSSALLPTQIPVASRNRSRDRLLPVKPGSERRQLLCPHDRYSASQNSPPSGLWFVRLIHYYR